MTFPAPAFLALEKPSSVTIGVLVGVGLLGTVVLGNRTRNHADDAARNEPHK